MREKWIEGPDVALPDLWTLVAAAMAQHPESVAVVDDGAGIQVTYAELGRRVGSAASVLRNRGLSVGDRLLIALDRSLDEVVWVLAAVRMGVAYVGVDRAQPPAAIAQLIAQVRPALAVTCDGGPLPGSSTETVASTSPEEIAPPPAAVGHDAPCYISFTSGSTGRPKGVVVPRRGVTRLVADPSFLRLDTGGGFLRLAPLSFDASTLEIFAPLASGARLHVFPPGPVSVKDLADFIADPQLTSCWLTAGLFAAVADYRATAFAALDQVISGGDEVSPAAVRAMLAACPGTVFTNGYGPTETTTFATTHTVVSAAEVDGPVPIGRPIANTAVRLGPDGELLIAGDGVALGYLDDEDETERRFTLVDDRRAYRSGDQARWDPAGRLLFEGRLDRQVKIRGHRVEPGAVEAVLRADPRVASVAVTDVRDPAGERRLVCAVMGAGAAVTEDELVAALRSRVAASLPAASVPGQWRVVTAFPLSPAGKIDHEGVRELFAGDTTEPRRGSRPAAGELVIETVRRIWAEVLGDDDFDDDEAFFDIGGDSLKMARAHAALCEEFETANLRMVDLFKYPTAADLAEYLVKAEAAR